MKDNAQGIQAGKTIAAKRRDFLLGLLTVGAIYTAPVLVPLNDARAASLGSRHGSYGSRHGSRGSRRGSHDSRRGSHDRRSGSRGSRGRSRDSRDSRNPSRDDSRILS